MEPQPQDRIQRQRLADMAMPEPGDAPPGGPALPPPVAKPRPGNVPFFGTLGKAPGKQGVESQVMSEIAQLVADLTGRAQNLHTQKKMSADELAEIQQIIQQAQRALEDRD